MKGTAYWIDNRNQILDMGTNRLHIEYIIQFPEKFGLSRTQIEETYEKYGERLGQDGEAQEEIIETVLKYGFIRSRLYPNQYWSITVENYTPRVQRVLAEWALTAEKDKWAGPYMTVHIVPINSRQDIVKTTIDSLKSGLNEDVEHRITKNVNITGFGMKTYKEI